MTPAPILAASAFAVLAALALAGAVHAQPAPAPASAAFDRCIHGAAGVTADVADCQTKEIKRRDAAMEAAYQTALARLPPARRAALRDDQRRWTRERDGQCRNIASEQGEGTAAGLDAQNCRIDKTRTRTAYLQTER